MKRKINPVMAILVLVFSLITVAYAQAGSPTPTPGKVYELTLVMDTTFIDYPQYKPWVDELQQASNGRLKIKVMQRGSHPYKHMDIMRLIRDGTFDIGYNVMSIAADVRPTMMLPELPYMFSGPDEARVLFEDPGFAPLRKLIYDDALAEWKQFPLVNGIYVGYVTTFDKFLTSFESMKGKRIRSFSKPLAKMITTLGGIPVDVSFGEVYDALSRGMLDGWVTGLASGYNAKWFEAGAKYATFTHHQMGNNYFSMNMDSFARLPSDLQGFIKRVSAKHVKVFNDGFIAQNEEAKGKVVQRYGVHLTTMDPKFREQVRTAMRPIWEEVAQGIGAQGKVVLQEIENFHKRWSEKR